MKQFNDLLFYLRYKKFVPFLKPKNQTLRHNSVVAKKNVATPESHVVSQQLLALLEKEKAALARELHDELGSNLMVMRINLTTALEKFGHNNPELANHLEESLQLLKKAVKSKCHIIENLRPCMLDDFGLVATLHAFCEKITSCTDIQIDIHIDGEFSEIDSTRSITLYRIVQESITNIVKHAHATFVLITLCRLDDEIQLHISDNGDGIPSTILAKAQSHGKHSTHGIMGMRERALMNGGSFDITPNKGGRGICIEVTIPYIKQQ